MTLRSQVCSRCLRSIALRRKSLQFRRNASVEAIAPASSHDQMTTSMPPIARYPPTQPPSLKPPEFRRSQIHRQYTSLLRSTPMMIFFQHTNLKAVEWSGVRRELAKALRKVDDSRKANGHQDAALADHIKITVINPGVFGAALRIVEYYNAEPQEGSSRTDPTVQTSSELPPFGNRPGDPAMTHGLSRAAWEAAKEKVDNTLKPLLAGPLALLTFPNVSAEHLKASLSVLSPQAPDFPAPKRRAEPGYYEPSVQTGIQKLLLLGGRVEGKVFDIEGTKWVGSIQGGMYGLRAQLAAMLQGVGVGITSTLEGASRSLYFTMESRRIMLAEERGERKAEGSSEEKS